MSRSDLERVRERKAFLATQAELDRLRVTLAVVELRSRIVAPGPGIGSLRGRPLASMVVAIAAPILGMTRLARYARIASLATMAWRIARNWNPRRGTS